MSLGLPPAGPEVPGFVTPGGRYVELPPWLYPPEGADPVDVTPDAVFCSPGASAEVFRYAIPTRLMLRIDAMGFGSSDPTATVFATWRAKKDGNPLSGLGYGFLPVSIGTLDDPGEVFIVLPGGTTLTIEVTNNYPLSGWFYTVRARGWLYSKDRRPEVA